MALDTEDLVVIAAHLQDAVAKVRDMAFLPRDKRFALILNRFDWAKGATDTKTSSTASGATSGTFERRRCALRFEHVSKAQLTGFAQADKRQVLSLLTITFEQAREGDPGGFATLVFAGGGAIRLEVECIEAELRDLGTGWRTSHKPDHPQG